MTHPEFHFDREELTLDISGLTGGYTLGQVGELRLFDHAQVQFPHDWGHLKIAAATTVIDTTWHLHSRALLEGTLSAGLEYTTAGGVSGHAAAETALVTHLMERPTVQIDLRLTFTLDGTVDEHGFSGTPHAGVGLTARF